MIFHESGKQMKAKVTILISGKIEFKIKYFTRDKAKKGHYIMVKGSIEEEGKTIVNIYVPNAGAQQYTRQILIAIKGKTNSKTVRVGDFNTALTSMDRSSRQKISKETQALNDTSDQMDLIDIYRAFHPKGGEYTLFSCIHGTFFRIDHMLVHKASLSTFKKTEITSGIF